jgi:hypothetical protein
MPNTILPVCDWVYFATPSREDWVTTRAFADLLMMIIRPVYNSKGTAIANVKSIRQGDTILVVHGGGGKPYRPMFACRIVPPPRPVNNFDAFSFADASDGQRLRESCYTPDPYFKRFTGISIEILQDLKNVARAIERPGGNNTIRRWSEVFGATDSAPHAKLRRSRVHQRSGRSAHRVYRQFGKLAPRMLFGQADVPPERPLRLHGMRPTMPACVVKCAAHCWSNVMRLRSLTLKPSLIQMGLLAWSSTKHFSGLKRLGMPAKYARRRLRLPPGVTQTVKTQLTVR